MNLAVFFSYGMSLSKWQELGIRERELARYERLRQMLGATTLITYDRDRSSEGDLDGLAIKGNALGLPKLAYSIVSPILHAGTLRRADVLLTHQMSGAWSALAAKLLFRKPLVVRLGYLLGENLKRRGSDKRVQGMVRVLEYLVYRFADGVISTVPPRGWDHLLRGKPVVVIPNGIDTDIFCPSNSDAAARRPTIAYVGRLNIAEKNVANLIEAMTEVDARLVLIGDGVDRAQLESRVRALGIAAEFRGVVENRAIPDILRSCDAFVLPSHFEGNPKALLEAMACGLPVVTTRWAGADDIITHERNGLLCDVTPESIGDALRQLMQDRDLRHRLGRAARDTIVQRYGIGALSAREEAFIRRIAARPRKASTIEAPAPR